MWGTKDLLVSSYIKEISETVASETTEQWSLLQFFTPQTKWNFNIFRDVSRARGFGHLLDDGKESEGVVGVLRLPSHHPGQAESRSLCCNPGGLFVHCLCGECSFVWLLVTLAKCWLRSKPQTRPSAWNPKKGTPMSTYQPGEDLVRFPNLLADWNAFFQVRR